MAERVAKTWNFPRVDFIREFSLKTLFVVAFVEDFEQEY